MTYISDLIAEINETHPTLGNLVALLYVAVKARKMVLVVAPSGCGKSTAMTLIAKNTANSIMPDRLSIAGLATISEKLTSFRSVIVVDDIATTQTDYARKTTITTLSALCYTHRIESIMQGIEYSIEDFYGSALVGIQPVLLRNLMLLEEWDASIQDKALRYYHLFRPLSPCLHLPDVKLDKGLDIDSMNELEPDTTNKNWQELIKIGDSQWSRARSKEHLRDLLKAIASLEQRQNVIDSDYTMLVQLLRPMAVEGIIVEKEQLEGERYLDNSLLALLVEYYTYGGEYALAQVALDYKLSLSQCRRIMNKQEGNWQQISKSPTIYRPREVLIKALRNYNLELNGETNK